MYADGYRLKLIDPYGSAPVLSVRRPGITGEGTLCLSDTRLKSGVLTVPAPTEIHTFADVRSP